MEGPSHGGSYGMRQAPGNSAPERDKAQLRLGSIGIGLMGTAISLKLLERNSLLTVWNRDRPSLDPVLVAGSPRAVAERSDIVLICLLDTPAVEACVWGANGVATPVGGARLVIDFSTIDADTIGYFTFIGQLAAFDHNIATASDGPYKDLRSLIAAASARPNGLNLGSIGVGSAQHLSVELFKSVAQIEAAVVTYRSTPELVNAIATGEVQAGFETLTPILPQLGGRLRALAIPSSTRLPGLPGYLIRSASATRRAWRSQWSSA
jgi:hypothetical protein